MHRLTSSDRFAANVLEAVRRGGLIGGSPEGEGGEGDAGGEGGAPPKPEPPKPDPRDAELAKLKADLDAKAKAEADSARKEKDKKKLEEGRSKELLEAKDAELEKLRAQVEASNKRISQRADTIYGALSEAAQAKLATVKDALDPDRWLALVEMERDSMTAPGDKPPTPTPSGGPPSPRPNGGDKEGYEYSDRLVGKLHELGLGSAAKAIEGRGFQENPQHEHHLWMLGKDRVDSVQKFIDHVHDNTDERSMRKSVPIYLPMGGGRAPAPNQGGGNNSGGKGNRR